MFPQNNVAYRTKRRSEVLSKQTLREKSSQFIKACTELELSVESIVPVCAEWALLSYELEKNPRDSSLREDVIKTLERCSLDQPRGQGGFQASPSKDLACELKKASGVPELKQQLVNVKVVKAIITCAYMYNYTYIHMHVTIEL